MGFVWNILLSFSNEELWADVADQPTESCEPLDRINDWINDGRLVNLVESTYRSGVGNGLDANLYGGGFKHFDMEQFIRVVEAQKWKERRRVQLWIKGGEEGMSEEVFTVVRLRPRRSVSSRSPSSQRTHERTSRKKRLGVT